MNNQEYEIDLLDLCKALGKRWRLILCCTAAALAIGLAVKIVGNVSSEMSASGTQTTSASALISVDVRSRSKSSSSSTTNSSSENSSDSSTNVDITGESLLLGDGFDKQEKSTSEENKTSTSESASTSESGNVTDRINNLAKLETLCSVLLTRNQVLREVAEACNTSLDVIEEGVSVAVVKNTNLLQINVDAKDAALSRQVCTLLAEKAHDILMPALEAQSVDVVEVISDDELPTPLKEENGNGKLVIIAAVAGFLIPCIYVVMDYLVNPKVRTEGDVQNRLGLKLLGTIPAGKERKNNG